MIKAIGFDFGGVIVEFAKIAPSTTEGIAQITGLNQEEIKQQYYKVNHQANIHNHSYQDVWAGVVSSLGKPECTDQVRDFITKMFQFTPNHEMLKLLVSLKENYKLGLLSNNTKQNGERLRADGLDKYFDVFLISGEIGFQKPDPQAFQVLFDQLGTSPEETIFIDDSPSSLREANEIGYHPILFKNIDQLKLDLTNLNINF